MLGVKLSQSAVLWRGSLLPPGCEAVLKCLPLIYFGERFALEREQAPSPQVSVGSLEGSTFRGE